MNQVGSQQGINYYEGHEVPLKKSDLYLDKHLLRTLYPLFGRELFQTLIRIEFENTRDGTKTYDINGLNTMLSCLFGQKLLMNHEKRSLKLTDTEYKTYQTAFGEMPILTFGKTPMNHKAAKTIGAARDRCANSCLVNAFALSLYYRFDIAVEGFNGRSLDEMKVMFSDIGDNNEISEEYEFGLLKDAFTRFLTKLRMASICMNHIENVVNWDDSVFTEDGLQFPVIHMTAGFLIEQSYDIPRSKVVPPESLAKKIFPWLETVRETYKDSIKPSFFDMLEKFRIVILQDLALLSEQSSIFSQQSLMEDPEFIEFCNELESLVGQE